MRNCFLVSLALAAGLAATPAKAVELTIFATGSMADPLKELAAGSKSPLARMHALYALDGMKALDVATVVHGLHDAAPRVREHAVRLAESMESDPKVRGRLEELTDDPDARVRYQLAFSLGAVRGEMPGRALAKLARRDGGDSWFRLAILSSVNGRAGEVWVPRHPYLAVMAGKPWLAHELALQDVLRPTDTPQARELLSEIRAAQEELGRRIDRRGLAAALQMPLPVSNATDFAQTLGMSIKAGEPRGTHRRAKGKYKTRVRMPSKLDPHLAIIEGWLATEPQLTALAIVGRLAQRDADQFGPKQHSIVQRLLKALRSKAAERIIAATTTGASEVRKSDASGGKTAVGLRPPSVLPPPANRDVPYNPSAHAERRLR
jgi:HEAT repeat protein